jgi:hypothetical protein
MSDSNSSKQLSKTDVATDPLEELPGEKALLSFYDLEGVGLAIAAEGFTREELMRTVISQVRDPDPRISQKAITQFRTMMKETLELNGRIGKAARTRDTNGETQSVSTTGILSKSFLGAVPPAAAITAPGRTFIDPLPIGSAVDSRPDASPEKDPPSVSERPAVSVEAPAPGPGHLPTRGVPPATPPAGGSHCP